MWRVRDWAEPSMTPDLLAMQTVRSENTRPATQNAPGARRLVVAGCWLLLMLLFWLDDITGYELSFFVFYSVPVGLAAWYAGRWPAIWLALGATASWLLADYLGGEKYSARFYYYWNSTIHFLAFMINAVTIAKIKTELDKRHNFEAELAAAREALRTVAALLPACAACGKPTSVPANAPGDTLVTLAHKHPELADVLCADCRARGVEAPEGPNPGVPTAESPTPPP
jgi:hypothetical protein